jgi:TfoX/Sxy family transcriptional regulator of competence genes
MTPSAGERFARLVDEFADAPGVGLPGQSARRGFGSSALRVHGSIFAMVSGDRLVVKLPRARVDTLIGTGIGETFDAGKGRPMKEWLTVLGDDHETWLALSREALQFVERTGVRRTRQG